jgi:hypothetical protein
MSLTTEGASNQGEDDSWGPDTTGASNAVDRESYIMGLRDGAKVSMSEATFRWNTEQKLKVLNKQVVRLAELVSTLNNQAESNGKDLGKLINGQRDTGEALGEYDTTLYAIQSRLDYAEQVLGIDDPGFPTVQVKIVGDDVEEEEEQPATPRRWYHRWLGI